MDPTTKPMLAALQRTLPLGANLFEPKWDGLRCLAFVAVLDRVAKDGDLFAGALTLQQRLG